MSQILFLVGKVPKPGTIIDEVSGLLAEALRRRAGRDAQGPSLVVHRGLKRAADLDAFIDAGTDLCNPAPSIGIDGDRADILTALAEHGVPVPRSWRAETWAEARAIAERTDVVVKSARGAGRGEEVTRALTVDAPFPGPYVVEEWLPNDGVDRKLYVAGRQVFGLLKPSTLTAEHGTDDARPFDPTPGLRDLALEAAHAVGLHLCGIDVVIGPQGPAVVDVNPFPGYRGIDGAAQAVADHLLEHLS